jgi:Cu(I)/Ag(I) efflux system membrane protein CusA/SilA
MKNSFRFIAAILTLSTSPVWAQEAPAAAKSAQPNPTAATMPLVQGEVRKVDTEKGMVVLRHGDIPNLAMPPMTMGFDVADKKWLDGLKVGDKVNFQAEMRKGKAVVTEFQRVAKP